MWIGYRLCDILYLSIMYGCEEPVVPCCSHIATFVVFSAFWSFAVFVLIIILISVLCLWFVVSYINLCMLNGAKDGIILLLFCVDVMLYCICKSYYVACKCIMIIMNAKGLKKF